MWPKALIEFVPAIMLFSGSIVALAKIPSDGLVINDESTVDCFPARVRGNSQRRTTNLLSTASPRACGETVNGIRPNQAMELTTARTALTFYHD